MKLSILRVGVVATLFAALAGNVYADYSIEKQLQAFKKNPKAFMTEQKSVQKYLQNYVPGKVDEATGQVLEWKLASETELAPGSQSKFSKESVANRSFIAQKNQIHEGLGVKTSEITPQGRAIIDLSNDNAEVLVGKLTKTKLKDMEGALQSATVPESPWSGDYWAIYTGELAKRYSDPNFPNSETWKVNEDYLLGPEASSCSVDALSPAEKYDLLVGDQHKTLTKAMLAEGRKYFEESGSVETWMGICHGWSPAAYMVKRPVRAVEMLAADKKTKIKFYPSDIKALASLLWAKAPPEVNFVGTRCNLKDPATDPDNGRILDQSCFDTNPGTWHQAVVNMIGVKKKSFVLDATYDYEVWNQPAYSYQYTYFNPKTGKVVEKMSDAVVAFDDEEFNDIFRKYRNNPKAVSVVGIAMKFVYIAETAPSTDATDSAAKDRRVAVNYLYDVELDKEGTIVGGEWYHVQHPDFMWSPKDGQKAQSVGDTYLSSLGEMWADSVSSPIPASWKAAAVKSSQRSQPLAKVIDELVKASQ